MTDVMPYLGAVLILLAAMCPNIWMLLLAGAVVRGLGACVCTVRSRFARPLHTFNGNGYVSLTLVEREDISRDTRRLRFALPSPMHVAGLLAGQHVVVRSVGDKGAGEKSVSRPYTPVTGDDRPGFVDLVVKIYLPNVHPKFPEGGAMSARFERLQIGQTLDFFGPKGHVTYRGRGRFCIGAGYMGPHDGAKRALKAREICAKHVGMVCGGSGVTPMLHVAGWARRHDRCGGSAPTWSLLAANQTPADVLCREQIDALEKRWPAFRKWYTVDRLCDTGPNASGDDIGAPGKGP